MSLPSQCCFVLLVGVLICQASAGQPKLYPVTINIFNDAAVPDSSLEAAKREASRIFTAAHIQIHWNDCTTTALVPPNGSCHDRQANNQLHLRIVRTGKKEHQDIFGIAFLGANGIGTYSDVFYDSVEKLRGDRPSNIGRLLGHVMAHEIGHLLIGSHAHSPWGLMCAKWHAQELRSLEMGTLFFTAEQEKSIHRKLEISRQNLERPSRPR
jgi:hypothetical protein